MKKIYHLASCSTCQRIIKEIGVDSNWVQREIKSEPITVHEIEKMFELTGSYELLFSRRALKFRSMGLHEKQLNEDDYKKLILSEYTFLKRPVVIIENQIFVGNSPGTIKSIKSAI